MSILKCAICGNVILSPADHDPLCERYQAVPDDKYGVGGRTVEQLADEIRELRKSNNPDDITEWARGLARHEKLLVRFILDNQMIFTRGGLDE